MLLTEVIRKLNNTIAELENKNQELLAEMEQSTSDASVCTQAVGLNLISSYGAKTIQLTVPDGAQMTLSTAAKAAENADIEGRMSAYAGD